MRCMISLTLAVAALLAGVGPARAQAPDVGTLLRVRAASCWPSTGRRWIEGRLVAVRNDSLHIMSPPRAWACPAALIGRLQVAANQDVTGFTVEESAIEGVMIGGGIGLAIGVVVGLRFAETWHGSDCGTAACDQTGFSLTRQAHVAIGWAGLVFGMLVGAAVDRTGWWDDVPVPVAWPDDPAAGAAVASPVVPSGPLVRARADRIEVGLRLTLPAAERRED